MTQRFVTASGRKDEESSYVPLAQTIADVSEILKGTYDNLPPESFRNIATIDDLKKITVTHDTDPDSKAS